MPKREKFVCGEHDYLADLKDLDQWPENALNLKELDNCKV